MGSMRNAVKRGTHKERAQPLARRRFGLLEKKKDYKLRAKDFHRKEEHLQVLRRKAEEKNPDEFYFSMQNEATKDGVHIKPSAEANKYTQEELRLMKTQDLKYIDLKAQCEAKKVKRLQDRLHFVGQPSQAQHTVFVDDEEELRGYPEDGATMKAGESSDGSSDQHDEADIAEEDMKDIEAARREAKLQKYKQTAYNELEQRRIREGKLKSMANDMSLKKALMGKGTVSKIPSSEPGGKPVYKWRLYRKK